MGLGVVLVVGRDTEPPRTEEEDGSAKLFFFSFFLGILFYFKLVEGKF